MRVGAEKSGDLGVVGKVVLVALVALWDISSLRDFLYLSHAGRATAIAHYSSLDLDPRFGSCSV